MARQLKLSEQLFITVKGVNPSELQSVLRVLHATFKVRSCTINRRGGGSA